MRTARWSGCSEPETAARRRPRLPAASWRDAADHARRPAPLRRRAHAVHAHHARRARSSRLGFVQADPIRAPARAQDLTLRHRVNGYRAGDLERRYARLAVEEDCLVNYGFLPRDAPGADASAHAARAPGTRRRGSTAADVLAFIRERGPTHPRVVEREFAHGRTQRLGRLEQRDHAPARRHALPRPAARGAARGRHAHLRGGRARRRATTAPPAARSGPPR